MRCKRSSTPSPTIWRTSTPPASSRTVANFEDLFYRNYILPGNQDSAGQYTPTGIHVGLGVRVQSTQADFAQGAFEQTNRPLDWAINGDGFFQVTDPSGQIYYSRAGNFGVNANGNIVLSSASDGRLLDPAINIPQDTVGIVVSPEGIGFGATSEFTAVATGRANSAGAVYQSARLVEAGSKLVSGNGFVRLAAARQSGHAGLRTRFSKTSWKIRT